MQVSEEIISGLFLNKLATSVERINEAASELNEALQDCGNSIITVEATDLPEDAKAVLLIDRKTNRRKLFFEHRPPE
jgi:hypothetical protein